MSNTDEPPWTPEQYVEEIQALINKLFDEQRFRITHVFLAKPAGPMFLSARKELQADGRDVGVYDVADRWVRGKQIDRLIFDGYKSGKKKRQGAYLIPPGCDEATYIALREQSRMDMVAAIETARLLS